MNQLIEFVEPHPAGAEPKDKEHALNEIRLPRTIWPHDACEVMVELANNLCVRVGFEVLQHHVVNYQSRLGFPSNLCIIDIVRNCRGILATSSLLVLRITSFFSFEVTALSSLFPYISISPFFLTASGANDARPILSL